MRLLTILLLLCATGTAAEPRALVERAIEAVGGAEALARVKSCELGLETRGVGSWRAEDGPARYVITRSDERLRFRRGGGYEYLARPRVEAWGLVTRTWTHGGTLFTEHGLDEGTRVAWAADDPAAHAAVLAQVAMVLPDRLLADDVALAPAGADAIEARVEGNAAVTIEFDPGSGRPRRARFPSWNGTEWRDTTLELDDWRPYGGIAVAHRRIRSDASGLLAGDAHVTAVTWNGAWIASAPPTTLHLGEVALTLRTLPAARAVRVEREAGTPAERAVEALVEQLDGRLTGSVVLVGDAQVEAPVGDGPLPDGLRAVARPALRVVSVPFVGAAADAVLVRDRIERWCTVCGERVAGPWRLGRTDAGWRVGAPVEPR